jgi:hypothetical protein
MIKRAILLATKAFPASALAEFAVDVEAAGSDSLWLPEAFGREPFATARHLLARADGVLTYLMPVAHAQASRAHRF